MRRQDTSKSFVVLVAILALGISTAQAKAPALADADASSGSGIRDSGSHHRPQQLDLQLGLLLSWFGPGLGVGVWYAIPVVPDGFIPGINDSFDIEFGAALGLQPSVSYYSSTRGVYSGVGLNLIPAAGVRWNFFLNQDWSLFASVKLAWDIYFLSGYGGGLTVPGTIGALFKLGDSLHLRLEAGYPFGLSAGLTFDI